MDVSPKDPQDRRAAINWERCVMSTMRILAAVILASICATGAQAQVQVTRSMEMEQLDDLSWVVRCSLEYSGIDPTHRYGVAMVIYGPPGQLLQFSTDGTTHLDSSNRRLKEIVPGFSEVLVFLRRDTLIAEFTAYTNYQLQPVEPFNCMGAVRDVTTGEALSPVTMTHRAR